LDKFLRGNSDLPWNSLWFDFLDFMPTLTKFLIGLNYTSKLRICRAAIFECEVPQIDITRRLNELRSRENSLYIIDFRDDLGINSLSGYLVVVYEFQGKGFGLKKLKLSKNKHKLLINYETFLSHDQSIGTHISNGYIVDNKFFDRETAVVEMKKTNEAVFEVMLSEENEVSLRMKENLL